MDIPVRCFTCNKIIAAKWETYKNKLKEGLNSAESLDAIGFTRYCCRRMFLSHADINDQQNSFLKQEDSDYEQKSITKNE